MKLSILKPAMPRPKCSILRDSPIAKVRGGRQSEIYHRPAQPTAAVTMVPATRAQTVEWTSAMATEVAKPLNRSEEHTSELQSLMRISYAVFCLQKKRKTTQHITHKYSSHSSTHTMISYAQHHTEQITQSILLQK